MRRSLREHLREVGKADAVPGFEPCLADLMLLGVMQCAKADAPAVRRLETGPTIGAGANVSTFDRQAFAGRHGAVMTADPRAVSRAVARRFG